LNYWLLRDFVEGVEDFWLIITKKKDLIKKTLYHFKMSNKHVFCKFIITDIHFPLSHPHHRSYAKEFEKIEFEYKNRMKVNDIQKRSFMVKKG